MSEGTHPWHNLSDVEIEIFVAYCWAGEMC